MNRLLPSVGVVLAVIVVVLGAYTRLSDAGLGCPDWPGCYGHVGVPESHSEIAAANSAFPQRPVEVGKAWKEMVHRYAAGLLGLLILVLFLQEWFTRGEQRGVVTALAGLVILQVLLGMWTVTLLVKPLVVTAHLVGGLGTLTLLWLIVLGRQPGIARDLPGGFPIGVPALMLAILVVQILLGGWTSTNYAALACVGLPQCNGQWLPAMDFANGFKPWHGLGIDYEGGILDSPARIAIHYSHRVGAVITFLVILAGVAVLWRRSTARVLRQTLLMIVVLLLAQFCLGLANVWFYLPLPVAVAHNGVAALLLLAVATLNYLACRSRAVSQ
ncbi:MAG TPA: cytochrome B [Gammaproteobacteria bacterium]|nr:cytochrome B [Gammaproteobacteria bacterium]